VADTARTTGGADALRAAAADLDRIAQARLAARSAELHLTEIVREVLDRQPRTVTAEQVAAALGITRRGLYKRLV
jgi:hypothetical protein